MAIVIQEYIAWKKLSGLVVHLKFSQWFSGERGKVTKDSLMIKKTLCLSFFMTLLPPICSESTDT